LKSLQWFTKQTILFIYLFILTESSPKWQQILPR
jgi:hypothetical protein